MSEEQMLRRSFEVELEVADGRTIEGRAVPYDETAEVVSFGVRHRERFEAGAFKRATRAPNRLVLLYEHRDSMLDIVGPGLTLEERSDGLYGSWRALDGPVGDTALSLVRSGILSGLSIGFRPLGPGRREEDGTLVRTSCHLDEVSLTREPAYSKALVTAVRSAAPEDLPEILRPLERNADLDERLRKLGIRR